MVQPTLATARIQRFLAEEPIVWLSTVRPTGGPHLVPIWFWWDGEALLVFSKPDAQKVRNLRANPSVMLALGDAEDDFDVGLLEAWAEVTGVGGGDPAPLPAQFLAKYRERIVGLGITPAEFAATYSATIRLTPSRALGWHGRSTPRSWLDAVKRLALGRPAPALLGAA
jgi:PPOX class probable F420-dependent enzyme